jgi:hypothetical protein
MPEIRRLAQGGTYEPDTLDLLSGILAEVWTEVGHAFKTPASVEEARNTIAKTLLYHAGLGLNDPSALKTLALETLRQNYPKLVI